MKQATKYYKTSKNKNSGFMRRLNKLDRSKRYYYVVRYNKDNNAYLQTVKPQTPVYYRSDIGMTAKRNSKTDWRLVNYSTKNEIPFENVRVSRRNTGKQKSSKK